MLMAEEPTLRRDRSLMLPLLAAALLAGFVLTVAVGPVLLTPGEIGHVLLQALGIVPASAGDAMARSIILDLRLPRALAAVGVGAVLAMGGAIMQGMFRNPLADPGLIGVSGGAALATATFIVFGGALGGFSVLQRFFAMPLAAFIGGLAVALLIQRLAQRNGRTDVATMLLAGIAVTAMVMAGIGLLTFISDDAQLRSITFWSLGSLGGVGWEALAVLAPTTLIALAAGLIHARVLDAMILGEVEAYSLGFDVEAAKRRMVVAVAVGVGAAVAFTGLIGFVGIVAPHMVRLAIGPTHRRLLLGSAMLGGLLLVLADTACRTVVAPAELPIGIVTSLAGAPFFLALLLGRRRDGPVS
jgi:iron complex transport system permease protein